MNLEKENKIKYDVIVIGGYLNSEINLHI